MSSLSRLLVRGSVLRIANLVATVGIAFLMIPFLIDHLGQRYYGMWTLIGTILAYLGFIDLGLSKAVQNFVARAIGRNSSLDANRTLSTSFWIFVCLGMIAFGLAVVAAVLAPLFLKTASDVMTFRLAICILGVNAAIAFPVMAFNGFFSANLRYDVVSVLGIAVVILRSVLIVVAVKAGYSIIGMAVAATVANGLGHVAKLYVLKKMFSSIRLSKSLFDARLVRELYSYGGKAFVHEMADLLRFRIDLLVVGAWVNLSAVAVYTIAAQLAEYFRQLLGMIFGVTVPVYAQLGESKNTADMKQMFAFSSKLAIVMAVFIGGNAIIYGGHFINLWIGPDFQDAYPILVILIIGATIHVSQEPALALLYGLGKHGRYAGVSVVEGVLNLILSIVLVQVWGLIGVAYATSLSILLTAGCAFQQVVKQLELSIYRQGAIYGAVLLVGICVHIPAFLLVARVLPTDFLTLMSLAGLTASLQALILWRFLFTQTERAMMLNLLPKPLRAAGT